MSEEEDILSESEEEEASDFSASEDEWLPTKKSKNDGNSAEEDDSDLEDFNLSATKKKGKSATSRKRSSSNVSASKQQAKSPKKKRLSLGLRDRLFQQYKKDLLKEIAPARAPVNSSVSDILQRCQYKRHKAVGSKQTADDSDSSGDDHLVDPDKLDLQATFFNKNDPEPSCSTIALQQHATNAEKLSDSSDNEKEPTIGEKSLPKQAADKLISHIKQQSFEYMNFTNLNQFTAKIKEAKELLKSYQQKVEITKSSDNVETSQPNQRKESVSHLLTLGEMDVGTTLGKNGDDRKVNDTSGSEWEEVETGPEGKKEDVPTGGKDSANWQLTIEMETAQSKRQRREELELELYIKREINKIKRRNQLNYHKTSILCAIAIGQNLNRIVNAAPIREKLMPIMQDTFAGTKHNWDEKKVERLAKRFKEHFALQSNDFLGPRTKCNLKFMLLLALHTRKVVCLRDYILLFLACLRIAGAQARLTLSADVPPKRPTRSELYPVTERQIRENFEKLVPNSGVSKQEPSTTEIEVIVQKAASKMKENKLPTSNGIREPKDSESAKVIASDSGVAEKDPNDFPRRKTKRGSALKPVNVRCTRKTASLQIPQLDGGDDQPEVLAKMPSRALRSKTKLGTSATRGSSPPEALAKMPSRAIRSKTKLGTSATPGSSPPEALAKMPSRAIRSKIKSGTSASSVSSPPKALAKMTSRALRSKTKLETLATSPGSSPFAKRKSNTPTGITSTPQNNTPPKRKLFAPEPQVISPASNKRESKAPSTKKPTKVQKSQPPARQIRPRPSFDADDDDDFEGSTSSKARQTKKVPVEAKDSQSIPSNQPNSLIQEPLKIPRVILTDIKKSCTREDVSSSTSDSEQDSSKRCSIQSSQTSSAKKRETPRKTREDSAFSDASDDSDDSDFVQKSTKRKLKSTKRKVTSAKKSPRAGCDKSDGQKTDLWIEIYDDKAQRWFTFDLASENAGCVAYIVGQATNPISYVFAWDNEAHLKDVTARYVEKWNTACRMLRVEQAWLDKTFRPFAFEQTERDQLENKELNMLDIAKPLPKTISELKNHPLYALQRHLLKFEALYPPEPPILGYVRGECIYPRECVHTLQTREKWFKQGRVVRSFETAYKVVKCWRYDRPTNTWLPNQPCDIFGHWQTDEYDPPTAENGIVPRNEYGTVDLFTEKMLPKKTVHIKLPGLNKVCKRLGIDCAAAVTGFEMAKMRSVAVYEGFVICEEFEVQAVQAWFVEDEQEQRRQEEKREKRIFDNWKRLIKGLLVRRKLQNKYNFDNFA